MRTMITAGGVLALLASAPATAQAAQTLGAGVSELAYGAMEYHGGGEGAAHSPAMMPEDCTQAGANRAPAKRSGPFGWLMRGMRDDRDERDDEEPDADAGRYAGAGSHYYLRSPLLTSLFSTVPCPQAEKKAEPEAAAPEAACALLVIRGMDGEELVDVRLPYGGAATVTKLRAVVSDHQARGEPLLLPYGQGETELLAAAIREVRPSRC